jgi:hypothetical protein
MQNRYCGDAGDFGKYGLLKNLCAADDNGPALALGVVWYLVGDEDHNANGKFTGYLDDTSKNHRRFRACDPVLWDQLRQIVNKNRCVRAVRENCVLPEGTAYYEKLLSWSPDCKKEERVALRARWLNEALTATRQSEVVFFDPDNGLDTQVPPFGADGPKFAFIREVVPFYQRGQSLVCYQHACRRGSAVEQAEHRLSQLTDATGAKNSFALYYRRFSARLFLVVPSSRHGDMLRRRAQEFCLGPWGRHFELMPFKN